MIVCNFVKIGALSLVLLCGLLAPVADCALFSWLFEKDQVMKLEKNAKPDDIPYSPDLKQKGSDEESDGSLSVNIPFESRSSDEKFLIEAAKYTSLQLSELDKCHHKVILGLHSSCSDMSNEELSKVAVNLFNCQSFSEGRQIYQCSSDMSLEDCTKNMDPNTWNAYHIVSNRVRAVCYASRQEQFRAKTEITVNKLMYSAEHQIQSMNDLQKSQEDLGKATSETFDSLNEGHEVLQKQQKQLSVAQHTIQSYVSSNLRDLYKEKRIIAAGQKDLALITEAIKKKLDEAKNQLSTQEESHRNVHDHILRDLSEIQDDARKVWQKLDASTTNILLKHEETVQQFSRLTQDLRDMNVTVHHLMDVLQSTKGAVEDKLSWISTLVGGTDNTVQKVYSCCLHAGYFLIGMLAASFLQVPYFTRVALVVLVPLNALSEVKHESSLQFSTLTTLLAICVFGNLIFSLSMGFYHSQKGKCFLREKVQHNLKYEIQNCLSPKLADISGNCFFNEPNSAKIVTSSPPEGKSLSSFKKIQCDEYSDNEEESKSLTPLPTQTNSSFLRRRVLDCSIGIGKEASDSLNTPKIDDDFVLEQEKSFKKSVSDRDSEKTLHSVKRHLLDILDNSHHSIHDSSILMSNRSRRNTPMRETLASSRSSSPSKSLTLKQLCASSCKNGKLCRNRTLEDSLYCRRHEKGSFRD